MIHPYLQPIQTSALLFPLVALALLLPVLVFQYRRFGHLEPWRWFVFNAFVLYGLAALSVVMLPLPEITPDFCEVHKRTQTPQVAPFQFLSDIRATWSLKHFQPAALLSNRAFFQALFNFLLLLPLGVFLAYYVRVRWMWALVIAFGASLTFEVAQFTGIFGIYPCAYRLFDVDDLILNTSGAMAGFAIAPLFAFLPSVAPSGPVADDAFAVSKVRRAVAFAIDMLLLSALLEVLLFWVHSGNPELSHFTVSATGVACYFVAMPASLRGFTAGKWLVRIKLAGSEGRATTLGALVIRYTCLLVLPMALMTLIQVAGQRDGYFDGVWGLAHLAVLAAMFAAFVVWPLMRKDGRGLHELVSGTRNVLALPAAQTQSPGA